MNPRPPDPTSDPAAPPVTASGTGGDTNPHPAPAPGPHNFLSPPQAPDEIGRLGAYRVLAELGRGGMGVVFRAEDTTLRRQVALKVMLPDVAADARAVARFLREARAQAAVEHEHVAVIHYVGEANGVPFIAMPLLKGQTLAQALKQNPRPPLGEVVRIGREMAEGLAASHDKGLIHRDIKPANVWLDGPKRRVRILDFGLARAETATTGDDEQLTGRGAILGTPAYMSPEQAKGEPVDHRSDLFSLGVVLYEMATGTKPFVGANTLAVLFAVAEQIPPAAHQVADDVPLPLSELIWRLMAKVAPDRPANAAAVVAQLEAFESGLSTSRVQVLPVPAAVAVPVGPDPWAELTVAPDGAEDEEDDETEHDEPPVRSKPAGVPRWVWPAAGAAVLLAVAAGVWVAMPPRPKAVVEAPPDVAKPIPGSTPPPPKPTPKDNPPPNVPAPAAPVPALTAENRAALEWVLANGGQLLLSIDAKDVPISPGGKLPDGPFAVVGVSFIGAAVPDDAPARLAAAPRVQRGLGLNRATFADATLAKLLALPCFAGIAHLTLSETAAGDAAMVAVANLPALESLDLTQTKVTDAGLAPLRGLKLQTINLHLCPVTDAGMDHLADMTTLTRLWLMSTRVTDAGFAKLSKLTGLTYLHPGAVTDAAVETLLTFRQLTELYLLTSKVTPAGLKRLSALPALARLALGATPIADADLAVLQDFPLLREVSLNTNKERITDAGLKHLAECGGLRSLNLLDTRVTEAGVKALSAKLPLCEILWGADQQIRPKPLDEVLRASVAELLKAGVRVFAADGDKQREVKDAGEWKPADRMRELRLINGETGSIDFAVATPALRRVPFEGWDATESVFSVVCPMTEPQLRELTRLSSLRPARHWGLIIGKLPEGALAHLANLSNLKAATIMLSKNFTAVGVKHLATLPGLQHLSFQVEFAPGALAELRGFAGPELELHNCPNLDDAALDHLVPLKTLRELNLTSTKVTKAGVEKLAAALPRCRITWNGGKIEPRSALGYGLEFDGKAAHVTFPTLKYDGSHPLTFEMWVAPTGPPTGRAQFLIGDIESAGTALYWNPHGTPAEWRYTAMVHTGGEYRRVRHAVPAGPHPLTHLAVVYDRGRLKLFVDGKLAATGDVPGAFKPSGLAMMFGANPGRDNKPAGQFFEGTLAALRVSKSARYTADFVPQRRLEPDPDTLANYRCDQDTGDVLGDSSGNKHHGTIVGAKWAAANERDVAANRRGAERLNPYAQLIVRLPGGKGQTVEPNQPLPAGPFTVVRVYLPAGKWPADFVDGVFLPAMADLRGVHVVESQTWILQPTDAQLARLAALPVAESLTYLACGVRLSAAALDTLKRFPRLEVLRCRADDADDALLERLAELRPVDQLALEYLGKSGKVTARGLAAVAKLPVRHIGLSAAPAAAEYVKLAPDAPALTHLVLWGAPVADDDVRPLARCPRLEFVNLDATQITDAGLKHLEGAFALRYLGLTRTKVTDAGVKALAKALPRCRIEWNGGVIDPHPQPDRAAAEWVRSVNRGVTVRAADGTGKHIPPTAPLPDGPWELVGVDLSECPAVTDASLLALRGATSLVGLGLTGNPQLTDAGAAAFAGCKKLEELRLAGAGFTDAGLAHFAGNAGLRVLSVGGPKVTAAGLAHFKDCKKLAELHVTGPNVGDAAMAHFADCPNLYRLGVARAVGDAGLAHFRNCKKLGGLWLHGSQVTDEGLSYFADKPLGELWAADTAITDRGLEHLHRVPSLGIVSLHRTKVTEAGVKALAAKLPKCVIEWDGGVLNKR